MNSAHWFSSFSGLSSLLIGQMSSIFDSRNSTNSAYSAQLCNCNSTQCVQTNNSTNNQRHMANPKTKFKIGLGMSLNSPNKSFPTLGNMHWTCADINVPCQINQIKQAHWCQALRNQEVLCIQATVWKKHHPQCDYSPWVQPPNESCVCSDLCCSMVTTSPFRAMCRDAFSLLLCVYWWWARWNLRPWWCLPGGRGWMNSGCEAGSLLSRFK